MSMPFCEFEVPNTSYWICQSNRRSDTWPHANTLNSWLHKINWTNMCRIEWLG